MQKAEKKQIRKRLMAAYKKDDRINQETTEDQPIDAETQQAWDQIREKEIEKYNEARNKVAEKDERKLQQEFAEEIKREAKEANETKRNRSYEKPKKNTAEEPGSEHEQIQGIGDDLQADQTIDKGIEGQDQQIQTGFQMEKKQKPEIRQPNHQKTRTKSKQKLGQFLGLVKPGTKKGTIVRTSSSNVKLQLDRTRSTAPDNLSQTQKKSSEQENSQNLSLDQQKQDSSPHNADSLSEQKMKQWDPEVQKTLKTSQDLQEKEKSEHDSDNMSNSQIGSLVSYTINYMESKNNTQFKSLHHLLNVGNERSNASDSNNSLIVERESEQNHSSGGSESDDSIDSIHEEVDISQSEGSDNEPEKKQTLDDSGKAESGGGLTDSLNKDDQEQKFEQLMHIDQVQKDNYS